MDDYLKDEIGYKYCNPSLDPSHEYILPRLYAILESLDWKNRKRVIFDLGCGNGSVANELTNRGYQVVGVDASTEAIFQANRHYPFLNIQQGSVYEDLSRKHGKFPVVISLEVVEHLYYPRKYTKVIYDLLETGGTVVLSTPYHGWWKNLALALCGAMDRHFTALWDYGHIKFWSMRTLSRLLMEAGFKDVYFRRVGRIPPLAKSMIAVARKAAPEYLD